MLFDPLGDLRQVLIPLSYVILFTEVDKVNNRLSGKQEQWIDDFDLICGQPETDSVYCTIFCP